MTYYLHGLLFLFLVMGIHALYRSYKTREWIYPYFYTVFLASAGVLYLYLP